MSPIRLPAGNGPVTVSLLLPLITLASSLALRPLPAKPVAEAPAPVTGAIAALPAAPEEAPAKPAPVAFPDACSPAAATAVPAPRVVVLERAAVVSGAPAPAELPALLLATADASSAHGIEIRSAGYSFVHGGDMPIVLMDPTTRESFGIWNSEGDGALRRLQKTEKGPFLWFRHEGRDYVIRDPRLIERAEQIVEPQSRLGKAQGELGGMQGELGGQQGEIGSEQGEYGRQIADLAYRESELRSKLRRQHLSAAEERRLEAKLDELHELRVRVQAAMQSLARGQGEMATRQAGLARRQAELARRQAEVSRIVTRDLQALVREALRDGRAIRLGSETY